MKRTVPFPFVIGVFAFVLLTFDFCFGKNDAFSVADGASFIVGCWAPKDITIKCSELTFDPSDIDQVRQSLGTVNELMASGKLSLDNGGLVKDKIEWHPTDCQAGTLYRTFVVTKSTYHGVKTAECRQKIEILPDNNYLVKFPADISADCMDTPSEDIDAKSFGCDILAINRDTAFFDGFGDACFKRNITYRVINWCEYDGRTLMPTLIPRDADCDGNLKECTWLKVENGDVWIDDDDQPKEEPVIHFDKNAASYSSLSCDGKTYRYTKGFWQYTQVVKIYDNEAPVVTFENELEFCAYGESGAADCHAEVMIPFSAVDACTQSVKVRKVLLDQDRKGKLVDLLGSLYTIAHEGAGKWSIQSIPEVGLPVGQHAFMLTVEDECGNVANRTIYFTIEDCKSPAPICIRELSVDLMPVVENKTVIGGSTTVQATDFIASDITDCTPHPEADGQGDVKYYVFRNVPESLDTIELENFRSVTFTCEDRPRVPVFVAAVDGKGNWDYCTLLVEVIPGSDPNPCESENVPSVLIQGAVTNEMNEAVEQVSVALNGPAFQTIETDVEGFYAFDNLESGYDYTITPGRDDNPVNGVSTLDLALISKHILGIEPLDSPYKMIAADVNNSYSITTLDLIQIRKVILSISSDFESSPSWVFVPESYAFENPQAPWSSDLPQLISLNNIEEDLMNGDFIAVKKGDVNNSAIANSRMAAPRNVTGAFEITTQDVAMVAGNEYTLSFTADQLAAIQGYQFTLNFDNTVLELIDINYGVATEENFGLAYVSEGVITTSWNQFGSQRLPKNKLFSVVVRANKDAQLSELMSIGSRYTAAEAYNQNGAPLNVHLSFDGRIIEEEKMELYQNTPNPFSNQTQIGFFLPEAAEAVIAIYKADGQMVKLIREKYTPGHQFLEMSDLPAGVLFYSLRTPAKTLTKKMINMQ